MDKNKIKVLIIDDSAVTRNILSLELAKYPEIEVVGTAIDPYIARNKIVKLEPDVITLDIEMPRMDGITFLEKLMRYHPMPVIIIGSITDSGYQTALRFIELATTETVNKPRFIDSYELSEPISLLADKIRTVVQEKYKFFSKKNRKNVKPFYTTDSIAKTTDKIIAIGSSTGGTEALRKIIPMLPPVFPGVLIAQHMPEKFTKSFAESLDKISQLEVREAQNGDLVEPGLVLIARGNHHMLLNRSADEYYVEVKDGPLVCRQKPSVDVLFDSTAKCAGKNAVGIILTGMGSDGARGLLHMKKAGAFTIAQNEQTCVVYGMPKEAVKLDAVHKVLPLEEIPEEIIEWINMENNLAG